MFCPNCKCEYRDGFKYCSDCNIELVNDLPYVEDDKNQWTPLSNFRFKSAKKYYLLNGILGFIGGPLILLFSTIAATQSQRLPPEWGEQGKPNTSSLFIMLIFFMIVIGVNIIGIIEFRRKNKAIDGQSIRLLKFILLNFAVFVLSFVVFIVTGLITFKV